MNRYIEIDNILKYLAKIVYQNNMNITRDTVYSLLMTYGLTKEEVKDSNIREYFDSFINHFKHKNNIDVYVDERQKRFLQFHKVEKEIGSKCYKLYLSFPKEKIKENVNDIFSFIEKNKMETASKVADKLRSDSVVIRLFKEEDVNKVLNYINNNRKLVKEAKKTNPFSLREGVVALAYDDYLSYNLCVSYYVSNYINKLKDNLRLNKASIEDFKEYLTKEYYKTFITKEKQEKLLNSASFKEDKVSFYKEEECLKNWQEVTLLITNQINENFKKEEFFQLMKIFKEKDNNLIDSIIKEYLKIAEKKYNRDKMTYYIKSFIETNDYLYITREKGMRDNFIKNQINGEDIKRVLNEVNDYYQVWFNAINRTYLKYGEYQAKAAIYNGLLGDYSNITNGGEKRYREKLIEHVTKEQFKEYCKAFINQTIMYPTKDITKDTLQGFIEYNNNKENNRNKQR